jgi:ketosteroid isomerase-like protein
MRSNAQLFILFCGGLTGCAGAPVVPSAAEARAQVLETERAFARAMAERDHQAFAQFLSEEAVFFSGPKALRGKAKVAEAWARYFASPAAPFSWEPEIVEVLDSGGLALSSGPVRDPQGKLIARFTSIWRYEAPGTWRIVFDQGNPVCSGASP